MNSNEIKRVVTLAEAKANRTVHDDVYNRRVESDMRNDGLVEELRRQIQNMQREKDEMSKEIGRQRLLEQQRNASSAAPKPIAGSANILPSPRYQPDAGSRQPRGPVECYQCHGLGHIARNCRQRRPAAEERPAERPVECRDVNPEGGGVGEAESGTTTTLQTAHVVLDVPKPFIRRAAYLRVLYGDVEVDLLLDTGSDTSLIPYGLVKDVSLEPTTHGIFAANGSALRVRGKTTITVMVNDHFMDIEGLVTDNVAEMIVGIDWLSARSARWDFETSQITIDGSAYQLHARPPKGWCRRVSLQEDCVIPARTESLLPVDVLVSDVGDALKSKSTIWLVDAVELRPGLLVARSLVPDRFTDVPLRVMNLSSDPVRLSAGTVMAELQTADVEAERQPNANTDSEDRDELIQGMVDKVHCSVGIEERRKLYQVLNEYSDVLSRGENDLGRTDLVRHRIDTDDAPPVRQPLRRHPPAHLDAIQQHVSAMLQQDIIESAQSPWASNIVLVRKKDGTLRCCIDYRQVNNVTRKDAYPLPRTDMCLDAMTGASWFSTFDLRSSYHQVMLEPAHTDKTAFICREGMFKFKTMPFGLCNAGATFQRLMDTLMSGLTFEICLVYLDDIIVFGRDVDEMLGRLKLVLQRLRDAKLKIKPSKCSLLQKSVEFLGHLVSENGISAHPDKVSTILEWPTPCSVREVRAFIGICSYYRRFVKDFAQIAAPLHNLTGKSARAFDWTQSCQESFEMLQRALTSPPILAMPNDVDVYYLDVDASDFAIGGVLSQLQDNAERVIAYGSRKLSRQEVNYCVTRRELLAVVHFLKYYRHYLLGRTFVVRSDHSALQWLRKTPEPIGQQARWLEIMEEFDFQVVHRSGTKHGNADGVSRRPCRSKNCACRGLGSTLECRAIATPERTSAGQDDSEAAISAELGWTAKEVAAEQHRDVDVSVVVSLLEQSREKPSWHQIAGEGSVTKQLWGQWCRLSIIDGTLYRKFEGVNGGSSFWQVVMPQKLRYEFIRLAHEGMTGGHLGRKRTAEQVQRRAYWPGWTSDVRAFMRGCSKCTQYHRGKPPKLAAMTPIPAGEPWETVSVDITGPHPRSRKGNVYIVTLMDHFTKWVEAIAVPNHTAPVVARVLYTDVFTRFGMPMRLLTDCGAEFESTLFQELCKWMEIDKLRTSPYRPSTNGMLERFHRTLNAMIAKVVRDDHRDWCERLQPVVAAYRSSIHDVTGYTPNRLFLGRENRAPLDLVLGTPPGEAGYYTSFDDFVAECQEKTRCAYAAVRDYLKRAAVVRKHRYDAKVRPTQFSEGDWVWYYYPRRYVGKSPKWMRVYIGPYLVVRVIQPSTAVIQRSRRAKRVVAHFDKLKRCFGETPPSWLKEFESQLSPEAQTATPVHTTTTEDCELGTAQTGDGVGMNESVNAENNGARDSQRLRDADEQEQPAVSETGHANPTGAPEAAVSRPRRLVKRPSYLKHFVCRISEMAGVNKVPFMHQSSCPVCSEDFGRFFKLSKHIYRNRDKPEYRQWFESHPQERMVVFATRVRSSKTVMPVNSGLTDRTIRTEPRPKIELQRGPLLNPERHAAHGPEDMEAHEAIPAPQGDVPSSLPTEVGDLSAGPSVAVTTDVATSVQPMLFSRATFAVPAMGECSEQTWRSTAPETTHLHEVELPQTAVSAIGNTEGISETACTTDVIPRQLMMSAESDGMRTPSTDVIQAPTAMNSAFNAGTMNPEMLVPIVDGYCQRISTDDPPKVYAVRNRAKPKSSQSRGQKLVVRFPPMKKTTAVRAEGSKITKKPTVGIQPSATIGDVLGLTTVPAGCKPAYVAIRPLADETRDYARHIERKKSDCATTTEATCGTAKRKRLSARPASSSHCAGGEDGRSTGVKKEGSKKNKGAAQRVSRPSKKEKSIKTARSQINSHATRDTHVSDAGVDVIEVESSSHEELRDSDDELAIIGFETPAPNNNGEKQTCDTNQDAIGCAVVEPLTGSGTLEQMIVDTGTYSGNQITSQLTEADVVKLTAPANDAADDARSNLAYRDVVESASHQDDDVGEATCTNTNSGQQQKEEREKKAKCEEQEIREEEQEELKTGGKAKREERVNTETDRSKKEPERAPPKASKSERKSRVETSVDTATQGAEAARDDVDDHRVTVSSDSAKQISRASDSRPAVTISDVRQSRQTSNHSDDSEQRDDGGGVVFLTPDARDLDELEQEKTTGAAGGAHSVKSVICRPVVRTGSRSRTDPRGSGSRNVTKPYFRTPRAKLPSWVELCQTAANIVSDHGSEGIDERFVENGLHQVYGRNLWYHPQTIRAMIRRRLQYYDPGHSRPSAVPPPSASKPKTFDKDDRSNTEEYGGVDGPRPRRSASDEITAHPGGRAQHSGRRDPGDFRSHAGDQEEGTSTVHSKAKCPRDG